MEIVVLRRVVEGIQISNGRLKRTLSGSRTAGISDGKDRAPVGRRHASSADLDPHRLAVGIVNRNASIRIGIGRNIGNAAMAAGTAASKNTVLIGLAGLDGADAAA